LESQENKKLFYRFHDIWCRSETDKPKKNVELFTFEGIRQTLKGWWIDDGNGKERWIPNEIGRKCFAYHNEADAMKNFLARKRVQLSIMEGQIAGIKNALAQVEDMKNMAKIVKQIEGVKDEKVTRLEQQRNIRI